MTKMRTQQDVFETFHTLDIMEREAIIAALPKELENGQMRFHDAVAVCMAGVRDPVFIPKQALTTSDLYKLKETSARVFGDITLQFAPSRESLGVPFFVVMNQAANDPVEKVRIQSLKTIDGLLEKASDFNPDGVVNALTRLAVSENPSFKMTSAEATKVLEKTLVRLPYYKADGLLKRMLDKFEGVGSEHPSLKPWSILVEHLGAIRGDIFDATARKAISVCQTESGKDKTAANLLMMKCLERFERDGKRADAGVERVISPLAVQSRAIKTSPNSFILG